MSQLSVVVEPPGMLPSWVERDVIITNGHDPLGLETIATVRILPLILPGILALSRRARYFTFHQFVLDEFARRNAGDNSRDLDRFMRRAEYEYGYAVKLCEQCGWDARGVLGDIALRQHRWDPGSAVSRQLSIQTRMGGYGLFYRSPLIFFGLVIGEGEVLADGKKVPFDRLARPRAFEMAQLFRDAVSRTAWYGRYLGEETPIPKDVLREVADAACLCRLEDAPAERDAIFDVMFGDDQPIVEAVDEARQRRHSFAVNLRAIATDERSVDDAAAWRHQLWTFSLGVGRSGEGAAAYRASAAQWGALIAREYQQAALSIIWNVVCDAGIDCSLTTASRRRSLTPCSIVCYRRQPVPSSFPTQPRHFHYVSTAHMLRERSAQPLSKTSCARVARRHLALPRLRCYWSSRDGYLIVT